MALMWDMAPPEGEPGSWNIFFMVLSLMMAVIGSYTAIQFIETLMAVEKDNNSHMSKKGSAGFSVFAASWCIAINCVWVMHFLAMSAVGHGHRPVRYNLLITIASMVYIFVGAFIGLSILTFHSKSVVYVKRRRIKKEKADMIKRATRRSTADAEDLTSSLEALRKELALLLKDAVQFLSLRLLVASLLLGSGVVFMHFAGMDAMRLEDTTMSLDPVWTACTFPLAWVGSAVILFFLFHMHGFKRRATAAVIIGVAVNLVHYFGFFAGTFYAKAEYVEPTASGAILVEAEFASVVVTLLSSVARFIFMGTIARG